MPVLARSFSLSAAVALVACAPAAPRATPLPGLVVSAPTSSVTGSGGERPELEKPDCSSAVDRIPALLDAGRVESALGEIDWIGERCGPLDARLAAQRDALRADLGDPPGDAPPPNVATTLDTSEQARDLVDRALALEAANDAPGAERLFARARRMLERLTGVRVAPTGFSELEVMGAAQGVAAYRSMARGDGVHVLARLDATSGTAIPVRVVPSDDRVVVGARPGSVVVLGKAAVYYSSLDAPGVPLGDASAALFSPSGGTLVTIGPGGVDVRDGATGALRDHFAGTSELFAPRWSARFLANETVFVAALEPRQGSGAVVIVDLAAHELVVNEEGAGSALSNDGRFVALAFKDPASISPVVTAKIWDTRRPHDAPKSADLGQVSGMLELRIDFDRAGQRLALSMKEGAMMGQRPLPGITHTVSAATGTTLTNPSEGELRLTPTQDWDAVSHEYATRVTGELIPTFESLYFSHRTIARSADDKTLALVEGTYGDLLATNVTVLVVDPATRAILHRVPIESSKPSMIHLDFGPGDYVACLATQGGGGYIDRRDGTFQSAATPWFDGQWSPDGRLSWMGNLIRDLDAKRFITLPEIDRDKTADWFDHPDLRAVPEGVHCRAGEWIHPLALCRDRLRSTR